MIIKTFEKINNFILKYMFALLILALLVYVFTSFTGKNNNQESSFQYNNNNYARNIAYDSVSPKMALSSSQFPRSSSKTIKTYNLTIQSSNTEKVKNKIEMEINDKNAIIESFNSHLYYGKEIAYQFVIKVPTENLDLFIDNVKKLGSIIGENSSLVDVENQFKDNENRLKNLYARRDRLRDLMKEHTKKLPDILAVDRELNNVQNEIERLENSNKNINDNVNYSKIDLTILPEVEIYNFNNANWKFITSWKKAVNHLITFSQKSVDFALIIVAFLPVLFFIAIIIYIVKKILKKKK